MFTTDVCKLFAGKKPKPRSKLAELFRGAVASTSRAATAPLHPEGDPVAGGGASNGNEPHPEQPTEPQGQPVSAEDNSSKDDEEKGKGFNFIKIKLKWLVSMEWRRVFHN